jgi:hypothetical protein
MNIKEISGGIYYVGVNDRTTQRFEGLWPLPYGVSYNSYIIKSDKNVLVDTVEQSDYWFIKDDITELDAVRTQADNCYITYPNVQPGYLYVKLEPEMPKNFALAANATVHIEVLTDVNLK